MYMWVRPDSRSAAYQATNAAGIQRQSGTPASHKFSASDSANSAVTGHGAAFIIARNPSMPGASGAFASSGRGLEPLEMLREGPMIDVGAPITPASSTRPTQGRCDVEGDAEEILAQHAGDFARSAPDRRCAKPGAGDDRPSCCKGRIGACAR